MSLVYRASNLPITDVTVEGVATQQNLEAKRVQNALNLTGGQRVNGRVLTADGPVVSTDGVVYADTTSGAVDVELLLAVEYYGIVLGFKRAAGLNAYTVTARAGETIIDSTGASVGSITVTTVARWLHALDADTWHEV